MVIQKLITEAVMVNDHNAFRVGRIPCYGSEQSGLVKGGIGYSMKI